jgi:hypothetical protein
MPSLKLLAVQISSVLHVPRACYCPRALVPVIEQFLFLHLARLGIAFSGRQVRSLGSSSRAHGAVNAALLTLTGHSLRRRVASSELQLCRTIVSAHSAMMRLPAISIFESWPIRNVTTPAMIRPTASTTRPSVVSPVASLIQPMA